jgi:hypothetical protein
MIACLIRYDFEPSAHEDFARYAAGWSATIPSAGANLIGYFGPYEGSASTGYGLFTVPSLAAYEAYKAKLRADPAAVANFTFARERRFIRAEDRWFLTPLNGPHA